MLGTHRWLVFSISVLLQLRPAAADKEHFPEFRPLPEVSGAQSLWVLTLSSYFFAKHIGSGGRFERCFHSFVAVVRHTRAWPVSSWVRAG